MGLVLFVLWLATAVATARVQQYTKIKLNQVAPQNMRFKNDSPSKLALVKRTRWTHVEVLNPNKMVKCKRNRMIIDWHSCNIPVLFFPFSSSSEIHCWFLHSLMYFFRLYVYIQLPKCLVFTVTWCTLRNLWNRFFMLCSYTQCVSVLPLPSRGSIHYPGKGNEDIQTHGEGRQKKRRNKESTEQNEDGWKRSRKNEVNRKKKTRAGDGDCEWAGNYTLWVEKEVK